MGDETGDVCERDIVFETRTNKFRRINELHPSFLALQYPLLFAYGEDSFTTQIHHAKKEPRSTKKRTNLTMREFFAFRFQDRWAEGGMIKKFRSDTYNNVTSAARDGHTTPSSIGKGVKLPSSFTGLPHAHIVVFLGDNNKYTALNIDNIITAKLPNPLSKPQLYENCEGFYDAWTMWHKES
ncbi:hypothetical protein V2J09_003992 [Rumex salicifolius]